MPSIRISISNLNRKLFIVGSFVLLASCGGKSMTSESSHSDSSSDFSSSESSSVIASVSSSAPASVSSSVVASNSSSSASSDNNSNQSAFAEFTDPNCLDGQYIESLPDANADIESIIETVYSYTSPTKEQLAQAQIDVFDLAYPYGAFILSTVGNEGSGDPNVSCVEAWSNPDDGIFPESVWGIAINECANALDFKYGQYFISENNEPSIPDNDYYARGEISLDKFHSKIPDAAANRFYFEDYTDHLGLQTTLGLWSQYIHSVAANYTVYRFPELEYSYDINYMLNFAWALPRYLLVGENRFPDDFNRIMSDPDVRETILTLWGRTWLYYDAFKENTSWTPGAEELKYLAAIRDPEIIDMINRVRTQHACIVN